MMITSLRFFDRIIIGAHIPYVHQTIIIKFPMLITMSTHPLAWIRCISPFIFKTYRNAVTTITPEAPSQGSSQAP